MKLKRKLEGFLSKSHQNKQNETLVPYSTEQNKKIELGNNWHLKESPMSVFSCCSGQSFWMGKDIQVIVLGFSHQKVRIGIKAPPEIPILREEY